MTVLMVTGAYFPELSGAGLQCRSLIRACGDRVRFRVLTTSVDPALPARDDVEGVPVHRVLVSATSRVARGFALPRLIAATWRAAAGTDIVHLHGFSTKSRVVIALARLLGRRIIVKETSLGHDDGVSMKRQGGGVFRSFSRADRFVGVSPAFAARHSDAGLPPAKFRLIPNGVDLERFRPPSAGEQAQIRRRLGLTEEKPVVLFVGFFSREKRPDVLFDAWTETLATTPESTLVFVGRTRSDYAEVDAGLADRIRGEAGRLGCGARVVMIEQAAAIEDWYRAADIFVLPSTREGLPNVVLEAMASGLPCIVSRLPGVTDALIASNEDGVLVDVEDRAGLAATLRALLTDPARRAALGRRARQTVAVRYSLEQTAAEYVALYRELAGGAS
jgi:glycosyltransferase involved in cell wall biosynthesis